MYFKQLSAMQYYTVKNIITMKKIVVTFMLLASLFAVTGTVLSGCAPHHHLAGPPPPPPRP
jgi:hypothetical protein